MIIFWTLIGQSATWKPNYISANEYTTIECKVDNIISSANQTDLTLVGTVIVGGESFTFEESSQTRDGITS